MARFDTGTPYDSGALYDQTNGAGTSHKPKPKNKNMTRQPYYPSRIASQVEWLQNFRAKLPGYATTLGLNAAQITAMLNDTGWLIYVLGTWLGAVRAWGPACTDYVDLIQTGTGTPALPVFTAPAVPAGVATVPAGALSRIFDLASVIKDAPGYTDAIGTDLRILGPEDAADHPTPVVKLTAMQGGTCQCVKIAFTKYTHQGVYIESKRGTGGWEFIGIDTESPYMDERPLLVASQPEVREYRLRFWDKGTPNGDWSDTAKITVAP